MLLLGSNIRLVLGYTRGDVLLVLMRAKKPIMFAMVGIVAEGMCVK